MRPAQLLLVLLLACSASAQTTATKDILARRTAWNTAMADRDLNVLGSLVTPDYYGSGPASIQAGIAGTQTFYANLWRVRPDLVSEHSPRQIRVSGPGSLAVENGDWTERWKERDGSVELRGAYTVMWVLFNGEWRMRSGVVVPLTCKGACAQADVTPPRVPEVTDTDSIAGLYVFPDGNYVEIRREGNFYVARASRFGDAILSPTGKDTYVTAQRQYRFSDDALTMTFRTSGNALNGRKVAPTTP